MLVGDSAPPSEKRTAQRAIILATRGLGVSVLPLSQAEGAVVALWRKCWLLPPRPFRRGVGAVDPSLREQLPIADRVEQSENGIATASARRYRVGLVALLLQRGAAVPCEDDLQLERDGRVTVST